MRLCDERSVWRARGNLGPRRKLGNHANNLGCMAHTCRTIRMRWHSRSVRFPVFNHLCLFLFVTDLFTTIMIVLPFQNALFNQSITSLCIIDIENVHGLAGILVELFLVEKSDFIEIQLFWYLVSLFWSEIEFVLELIIIRN